MRLETLLELKASLDLKGLSLTTHTTKRCCNSGIEFCGFLSFHRGFDAPTKEQAMKVTYLASRTSAIQPAASGAALDVP